MSAPWCFGQAVCDMARQTLALSEHELEARCRVLELERNTFREMLQIALAQLARANAQLDVARSTIRSQRDRARAAAA